MILDLRHYETFPVEVLLDEQPKDFPIDYQGVNKVYGFKASLQVQKSGEEYYCRGTISANVNLECCRCLEGFDFELKSDTDFIVCSEAHHAEEKKEADDDEDYVLFKGNDLRADISDIIRQAIILAIDIKPICSTDCKGLCPQCGVNLNEKTCNCKIEKIDPRWEGLKKLSGLTTEHKE